VNRKRNTPPPQSDSGRSPFAGCAILIAVVGVVAFLLVFSVWTLFRQFDEIAKFTSPKPAPVGVVSLENKDSEINRLAEKVESFRQTIADKSATAELALDPAELNLAIASYDDFKELRGTFHVLELADGKARIAISFPLNGRPRLSRGGDRGWLTSDPRYLNGVMIARPELAKNEIVLRIDDIEVPGAKVPAEFVERMSPYRIAERYTTDPAIGPAMAALNGVQISDGKLVLSRVPGAVRSDHVSRAEVDSGARRLFRFLAAGAGALLFFVGIVLLIGVRAKRRKSRDS
jgi:hypothetical protein